MDKAVLLTRRCPERDVELDGVGTVRVRGLTRAEIKLIGEGAEAGKDMEPYSLHLCLVDPQLTEDEVRQWLDVAPFAEVKQISDAINDLSGIARYSAKEAYKSLRDEPGS